MGKYFTVDVKPTIAASLQHSAFANRDVLFDWTAFDVPKGSCMLTNATVLIRPKGDATPTRNAFDFHLIFSKTNTVSLGTVNSVVDHRPNNDILGMIEFESENFGIDCLQSTAIATSGRAANSGRDVMPMVLTPDPKSGTNVGYDKLYVAAIAAGAFDFTTINRINDDDIASSSPGTTLVCDGTSMDLREHFVADDVLHAQDDAVIGVVASVDSATNITLDEAIAVEVLAADDYVYNIHPILVKLSFEQ
jgi:hypothetical protein